MRYSRGYRRRRRRRKLKTKRRIDGKIEGKGLEEILQHIDKKKNKNKIEENGGYMEMSKKWENIGNK